MLCCPQLVVTHIWNKALEPSQQPVKSGRDWLGDSRSTQRTPQGICSRKHFLHSPSSSNIWLYRDEWRTWLRYFCKANKTDRNRARKQAVRNHTDLFANLWILNIKRYNVNGLVVFDTGAVLADGSCISYVQKMDRLERAKKEFCFYSPVKDGLILLPTYRSFVSPTVNGGWPSNRTEVSMRENDTFEDVTTLFSKRDVLKIMIVNRLHAFHFYLHIETRLSELQYVNSVFFFHWLNEWARKKVKRLEFFMCIFAEIMSRFASFPSHSESAAL